MLLNKVNGTPFNLYNWKLRGKQKYMKQFNFHMLKSNITYFSFQNYIYSQLYYKSKLISNLHKIKRINSESAPTEAELVARIWSVVLIVLSILIVAAKATDSAPATITTAEAKEVAASTGTESTEAAKSGIENSLRSFLHLFLSSSVFSSESGVAKSFRNFFFLFEELFAEIFEWFRRV